MQRCNSQATICEYIRIPTNIRKSNTTKVVQNKFKEWCRVLTMCPICKILSYTYGEFDLPFKQQICNECREIEVIKRRREYVFDQVKKAAELYKQEFEPNVQESASRSSRWLVDCDKSKRYSRNWVKLYHFVVPKPTLHVKLGGEPLNKQQRLDNAVACYICR